MTLYELIAIIIVTLSLSVAIGSFIVSRKAISLQLTTAKRKKAEYRISEINEELKGLRIQRFTTIVGTDMKVSQTLNIPIAEQIVELEREKEKLQRVVLS